jgi:hypothetical protein
MPNILFVDTLYNLWQIEPTTTEVSKMAERTMISMAMDVAEKEALKLAAGKEKRNFSNFILNSALERAKEKYGIEPKPEAPEQ